ncbi:MAG: glycine zipper 2TM domain-containing protein [Alphaproteobacteria bacterium]|nr:MAG: glycine zipper 2TM domain-containing protein [Alphaproteobacteria bacterium]
MKTKIMIVALAASLSLAGCAPPGEQNTWGMGNKQTAGAVTGGVLGGLVGHQIGGGRGKSWTTGIGAVLGALAGSQIGKQMDEQDLAYHRQTWDRAYSAPINDTITWNNPDNGHHGSITPIREGRNASTGGTCREYKQSIFIGGQAQTAVGTACQNSDGTWTMVN